MCRCVSWATLGKRMLRMKMQRMKMHAWVLRCPYSLPLPMVSRKRVTGSMFRNVEQEWDEMVPLLPISVMPV